MLIAGNDEFLNDCGKIFLNLRSHRRNVVLAISYQFDSCLASDFQSLIAAIWK